MNLAHDGQTTTKTRRNKSNCRPFWWLPVVAVFTQGKIGRNGEALPGGDGIGPNVARAAGAQSWGQ